MKTLQVRINGEWQHVFCRNHGKADPVTTKDARKALRADALAYFVQHFSNHDFTVR